MTLKEKSAAKGLKEIRRQQRPERVQLIKPSDLGLTLWLALGFLLAPAPFIWRWRLAQGLAFLAVLAPRARLASGRIQGALALQPRDARRLLRRLYTGRLSGQIEVPRGLLFRPAYRIDCLGLEPLRKALGNGQGAILWLSDFECAGDVTKIALARAGLPLTHLSRRAHGFSSTCFGRALLNPIRRAFEDRYLKARVLFDRKRPQEAMLRLRQQLQAGGLVSISASQHEGGRLLEGGFFSGRLALASGALRLALIAKAPLFPVTVLRDPEDPRRFTLTLELALPLALGLDAAFQEYLLRLEATLRQHPEGWVGWRRLGSFSAT